MTADGPFAPNYSRPSFFETLEAGEALRRLDHGLGSREPFLILTGEPGTGKTTLAHEAVARWGSRVAAAFLAFPVLTGGELLEEILRRFGADPPEGASRPALMASLERALAAVTSPGQVAIVILDDAHHLSAELLEELRLLVNAAQQVQRPIEVLLIGLPALEARLAEPALAALRQRVSVRVRIETLPAAETERYVQHRVTAAGEDGPSLFPRATCREIATLAGGLPRQINVLAAAALNQARESGQTSVAPEHVRAAAAALWGTAPTVAAREAPTPPPVSIPVPVAKSPPPPALPAPEVKPAESASPPQAEEAPAPVRVIPPSQDPREWVARFVGDKGPIQISSRAELGPTWALERLEDTAAEAPGGAEPSPAGAHGVRGPKEPRRRRLTDLLAEPRPKPKVDLRPLATVSLAAIALIAAVVLIARTIRHATSSNVPPVAVASSVASGDSADAAATPGATTRPPASPAKRSKRSFTLDVGGYADLGSALDARDRMQGLTGFQGWVVTTDENGAESYRVVLGVYRSEERATSAARMLINSRTLSRVKVVPLPPSGQRR